MQPFLFIVGKGRSGTTLVRAMLTSHPDLAIPPETHFIVPLAENRKVALDGGLVDLEAFMTRLQAHPGWGRMGIPFEDLERDLTTDPPSTYSDAIRRLFELYARREGKSRYGDKSPGQVLSIDTLALLFPEARFVHVVRDGRNVMLSNLETDFGPASVVEGALVWRRLVLEGRRSGASLTPARYCEVRYEDLLGDPETELARLCAFASLDYDEEMLRYFERADKMGASAAHHRNLRLPPTKGLRDWRTQMSTRHIAMFETLAGDALEEFGYEHSSGALSARGRAELGALWMSFQTRRARWRLRQTQGRLKRRVGVS